MVATLAVEAKSKTILLGEYFSSERFSRADTQIIGAELTRLAEAGTSTPNEIVDAARPPGAMLHPFFEWDDAAAAEKWRVEQARGMVQEIKVDVKYPDREWTTVRAFHAIHVAESEYPPRQLQRQTIEMVRTQPDGCDQIMARAKRELLGWQSRYAQYREIFGEFKDTFAPMFDAIDALEGLQ